MRWNRANPAIVSICLAFAGVAHANHLAPTSSVDCSLHRGIAAIYQSRVDAIDQQANSCMQANSGQGAWIAACGHLGPRNCLPVFQQACVIDEAKKQLQDQCLNRLDAYKARNAAEEKRRRDQEQAARDAENAARFGQQVPQGLAAGITHGIGHLRGAEGLSQALTQGGLEAVGEIQKRAVGQLTRAMADAGQIDRPAGTRDYGSSNPRPSGSHIDRRLAMLGESDRLGQNGEHSPFGGQGLVSGAYAAIATQIAEAYARGDIETPLDAIGLAAAAMAEWHTSRAIADLRSGPSGGALALVEDLRARQRTAGQEMYAALQGSPQPPVDPVPQPDPIIVEPPTIENENISASNGSCGAHINTVASGKNAIRNTPYGVMYEWFGSNGTGYMNIGVVYRHPYAQFRMTIGPRMISDSEGYIGIVSYDGESYHPAPGLAHARWWTSSDTVPATLRLESHPQGCLVRFSDPLRADDEYELAGDWFSQGSRVLLKPGARGELQMCWIDGASLSLDFRFQPDTCVTLQDTLNQRPVLQRM